MLQVGMPRQTSLPVSAVKSGIHTLGTNLVQVASVLTITAIIARTLGPERKGIYDLYVTTALMFSTFAGLSLPSGVTYVVASGRANIAELKGRLWLAAVAQGLGTYIVLVALKRVGLLGHVLPDVLGRPGLIAVAVNVGLLAVSSGWRAILVGLHEFIRANVGDVIKQFAGLVLLGILLTAMSLGSGSPEVVYFVFANLGAVIAAICAYERAMRHAPISDCPSSGFREVTVYSLPSFAANAVQFLNYRLAVYFVNEYAGAATLGLYQTATLATQALWLLPSAIAAITFPKVAAAAAAGTDKASQTAQCVRIVSWVSIFCAVGMAAFAPVMVPLVFGRAFRGAVPMLLLLLPGTVAFCPAQVLAGYMAGIGRPGLNLAASCVGAALTIGLNALLVPVYGASGAALATSISHGANAAMLYVFFVRKSTQRELFRPVAADLQLIGTFASKASLLWHR